MDEAQPVHPIDFNGTHRYAATACGLLHSSLGEIDAVAIRVTNVLDLRMARNVRRESYRGTLLRRLAPGGPPEVLGEGHHSRVYNIGWPEPIRLLKIAGIASRNWAEPG